MSEIIIEGTNRRNTVIAPGEQRRVERTPFINSLVRNGFAKIVDTDSGKPVEHVAVKPGTKAAAKPGKSGTKAAAKPGKSAAEPVPEFVDPAPTDPYGFDPLDIAD